MLLMTTSSVNAQREVVTVTESDPKHIQSQVQDLFDSLQSILCHNETKIYKMYNNNKLSLIQIITNNKLTSLLLYFYLI